MPPLPPVAKVVKVALATPVTVHPTTQSRIFISYGGTAPIATDLNTFAGSVRTAWAADLAPLFHANASLTTVTCEDLSVGGFTGSNATGSAGTRAGTEGPIQAAAQVSFGITRRYRGGKPKVFLNAGVEGDQADVGHWTAAFATALTTGWANFIAAVLAAPWAGGGPLLHVNVSYYQGFTPVSRLPFRTRNVPNVRPVPVQDTITHYTVPTMMASQRRRRS